MELPGLDGVKIMARAAPAQQASSSMLPVTCRETRHVCLASRRGSLHGGVPSSRREHAVDKRSESSQLLETHVGLHPALHQQLAWRHHGN